MTLRATSNPFDMTVADKAPRWSDIRDRVDIVYVLTNLLGPSPGRHGAKGNQKWWVCPFHPDKNPSFSVDPEKGLGHCFGCGSGGDTVALVQKILNLDFPGAVRYLAGDLSIPVTMPTVKTPVHKAASTADPDAMTQSEALALVEEAEARLWTDAGAEALSYLRGRGLTDETIRRFRLGWTPRLNRVAWSPQGVVIPWFDDDALVLVKVRLDESFIERFSEGRRPPRYLECFRSPVASDRDDPPCFPTLDIVEPGLPLVICEGELDCLLVGQELEGLAVVLTLGGASIRPGPSTLSAVTPAWPRFVCHDDDAAGDKAAASWPASFRRVKPPGSFRKVGGVLVNDKDWGDARANGVNLRRWWSDLLNGVEQPALYSWDELARVNGGGGIVIDQKPSREELIATLTVALNGTDPYEAEERRAIQEESL